MIKTATAQATQITAETVTSTDTQAQFTQLEQQLADHDQLKQLAEHDLERWIDQYLELGLDLAGQVTNSAQQASWLERLYNTLFIVQCDITTSHFSQKCARACNSCLEQIKFALNHLNGRLSLRQQSLLAYHENTVSCRQI